MSRTTVTASVDAICWDWNGTLLDDAEICRATMNDVLVRRGREPLGTLSDYRARFRFPIRAFYASVGIADHDFVDAADEYLALLTERIRQARLHADAHETLDAVALAGVRQVLASATLTDVLTRQMSPHGIAGRFEEVLGIHDAHAASKDAVITAWLQRSGLAPERVLMIGDTNHDQEIAARLGTRFVHFDRGHQDLASDSGDRITRLTQVLALI